MEGNITKDARDGGDGRARGEVDGNVLSTCYGLHFTALKGLLHLAYITPMHFLFDLCIDYCIPELYE